MSVSNCAIAAPPENVTTTYAPSWHAGFLGLLPAIGRQARHYFRQLDAEERAEAVAEVTANALIAYRRLVETGKSDLAYATPLAHYACRQYQAGRRVGLRQNMHDASSAGCQRRHRFALVNSQDWRELADDRQSTPAEIAAIRIDFAEWLRSLSSRDRKLVRLLARGESVGAAARVFRVTAGRISQLRRELAAKWRTFVERDHVDVADSAAT